jgi:integrase
MRLNGAPSAGPAGERDGTLRGLIAAYRASPEFQQLAARTKSDYQNVLDYLEPMGELAMARLTSEGVLKARDKAYAKHKRRFANYLVQLLRILCAWGKPRGWNATNPAADIPMIRRPKALAPANRPWSDAELDAVLTRAPASLRLAVTLGVCTGMREGDVIRFLWSGYDGCSIQYRTGKTGAAIWLPAHRTLKAAHDAAARKQAVVIVGERGQPFTSNGFQSRFFKFIRKLEAEGAIQPGLTFHGLRHTVGRNLAEAGCDTRTIAAVLGHKTEDMARHYASTEDQRRRAGGAIKNLERLRSKNGKH